MLKHAKKLLALFTFASFLLAIFFITGCNEAPTTSDQIVGTGQQLSKTATSATLHIYNHFANEQTIEIYAVSSYWIECDVTWNTRPSVFAGLEGSFVTNVSGDWINTDITGLVNKWLNGTYDNYGLLLYTTGTNLEQFDSREGTNVPYISIVYSDGSEDVLDIADTELNELHPEVNYCNEVFLFTGIVSGFEKKALLKFDIEPAGGCTLTPGYWKTHSEFGPAPYDDTWAQLPNGASTTFFLSGKSYYQVLWTSPAGNAYYNLSFHYIAAGLNFMNGADPSAAQAAYDAATILFNTYTPAQIAALRGSNPLRQQFISLAGILGNYNEGIIGPGHCD